LEAYREGVLICCGLGNKISRALDVQEHPMVRESYVSSKGLRKCNYDEIRKIQVLNTERVCS